jgi:hypothetical protein
MGCHTHKKLGYLHANNISFLFRLHFRNDGTLSEPLECISATTSCGVQWSIEGMGVVFIDGGAVGGLLDDGCFLSVAVLESFHCR